VFFLHLISFTLGFAGAIVGRYVHYEQHGIHAWESCCWRCSISQYMCVNILQQSHCHIQLWNCRHTIIF
jgi:hypothetical protein